MMSNHSAPKCVRGPDACGPCQVNPPARLAGLGGLLLPLSKPAGPASLPTLDALFQADGWACKGQASGFAGTDFVLAAGTTKWAAFFLSARIKRSGYF